MMLHGTTNTRVLFRLSSRTNRSYKRFTNVWLGQILDLHVVLHRPFISLKENHIRKGHEMTSEHFNEVCDPRNGHSRRCIGRLTKC